MTIGAVILSSLFRAISAQGQLTDLQSAREEVQQNSRASLELVSSELRAISTPGGVLRASRDSITFRSMRLWGVVCSVAPGALQLRVSTTDARHFSLMAGSGVVANLATTAEPVWTEAVPLTGVAFNEEGCEADRYETAGRMTLAVGALPQRNGAVVEAGDLLGVYDQITYRSGPSSGLPGRWIQRRSGDGQGSTNQPLAGPIRGAGVGLRFRYFSSSGAPMSPPGSAPQRDSIAQIQVVVDATSLDDQGNVRAARRDSVTVPLRNRR